MADRKPYFGPAGDTGGGRKPYFGGPSAAAAPKKKSGGVLGVLSQGLNDLETAAVNSPGGLVTAGKALAADVNPANIVTSAKKVYTGKPARRSTFFDQVVAPAARSVKQDIQHPLRHPGFTALDLLGLASVGAGTAARGAAVAGRIGEGGRIGESLSAGLRAPKPGLRTIRHGSFEATVPASRSALTRATVRQIDKLRERFPDAHIGLHDQPTRVGKLLAKERAHEYKLHTTPFTMLRVAGRKIRADSPQGRALRAVAEGTPLGDVIRTNRASLRDATSKVDRAALKREIRIAEQARQYVNEEHLPTGEVRMTLADPKLAGLFEKTKRTALLEDERMAQAGLLPASTAAAAIQKPAIHYGTAEIPDTLTESPVMHEGGQGTLLQQGPPVQTRRPLEPAGLIAERATLQARIKELRAQTPEIVRGSDAALQKKLDAFEKRYNDMVDKLAARDAVPEAYRKREQAYRNTKAGKRARKGLKRLPTVTEETRSLAEAKLLKILEERSSEPFVQGLMRQFAEARAIQEELTARSERHSGIFAGGLHPEKPTTAAAHAQEIRSVRKRLEELRSPEALPFQGGQFHVGQERRPKPFAVRKNPVVGSTGTIGIPRTPGRLTHALTGASIRKGGLRHDVPALVADNALESERHAALLRARDFFIAHAADTPAEAGGHPVAIRLDMLKGKPFPDRVKLMQDAYANGRTLDANETGLLGLTAEPFRQYVFPEIKAADYEKVPGVKWIDERLLGGLNKPRPLATLLQYPGAKRAVRFVDAVNNITKFGILYLKPAYAVPNILGNTFLNLTQQAVFAPINIGRAVVLARKIGPEDAALVDNLMGEGIATSLSAQGEGLVARATAKGSSFWSKPVDLPFRRASFLYEARKAGYRSPARIKELLHDQRNAQDLREVTERANRAIIDYGDLTPVEQEIIRRVLFFYPWLKGSTRYAGDYLKEHPQQAALLGQAGKQGKAQQQRELGNVPPFAEGLFKVGERNGMPLVANPTAAGILGQPADLAAIASGLLSGHVPRGREVSSLLTPFLGAGSTAISGYDTFTGRPVEPNIRTFLHELTAGQPIPTLISRLRHDQTGRLFPLSPQEAILQFLLGGVAPRPVDVSRLHAMASDANQPRR